jgi:tetratricopeptide (TPR) repeat protein
MLLASEGLIRDERRDFDGALALLDRALARWRELGEAAGIVWCAGNRGNVLSQLGRLGEALVSHEEACAAFERMGDRRGMAAALNNIGMGRRSLGDERGALEAWERAFALHSRIGYVTGVLSCGPALASARFRAGDRAGALAACRETFEAAGRLTDPAARDANRRKVLELLRDQMEMPAEAEEIERATPPRDS